MPEKLGITDQSQFKNEIDRRLTDTGHDNISPEYTFGATNLSHSFKFHSVYDHCDERGTSEVTTCTRSTKLVVDYIFYHAESSSRVGEEESREGSRKRAAAESGPPQDDSNLKLISRLKLFTVDMIYDSSIPDRNYPSDHFILAAKFLLT